jgi:hypothetical protein
VDPVGPFDLRVGLDALSAGQVQYFGMASTQEDNLDIVRRAIESDPEAVAENIVWHFQSPIPSEVMHFEGRQTVMDDWPLFLHDLTGGSFAKRLINLWAVGVDLVVAHFEVDMTIDGAHRQGSTVVVYRLGEGGVIEGFDIPSPSV